MKKLQEKIIAPPAVRAFFAKCGSKGGSSNTDKKIAASRKNGTAPCKPGKFRGRPSKNKHDESHDEITIRIKEAEAKRLTRIQE